ncbi:MAG: hypothetical protein K8I29_12025 [Alphaproteobacteria bacterium]|uniref:Uncharacterized protein n=1 Tax=Candidatus Nitrobium versatile TaxID=2884831 RepID=A0A953JFN4_9BACT|nr:hypothetical protein [Candidatus Nitrobium versatile]
MEVCYKCGKPADFICPDCGNKICRAHMEKRYAGPDRGFKSRFMCPSCWKKKQVKLNQDMINAREYKPKTYIYGK